MSDKERPEEQSLPPGRYLCEIEGYSGYIQFPTTLGYPAFKKWWKLGVEPIKDQDLESLKFAYWDGLWEGAKLLVLDYGEWSVYKGSGEKAELIPIGKVRENDVPLPIEEWVITCSRLYLVPQLDPKKARMLLTLF
jgi:hypothetical protein